MLHCASYSCSVFLILYFGSICFGCISEFLPKDLCLVLPSIMWPSSGWLHRPTFLSELSGGNNLWGQAEGLWEQHLLAEGKVNTWKGGLKSPKPLNSISPSEWVNI